MTTKTKTWKLVIPNQPDTPDLIAFVVDNAEGGVRIDSSIVEGALHLEGTGEPVFLTQLEELKFQILRDSEFPERIYPPQTVWLQTETYEDETVE